MVNSESKGIIYCLTNQAMPDVVKIGSTTNIEQRIKSLDVTSVPLPFECELALEVENAFAAERLLHDVFSDHRVRRAREFFEVSPQRVTAAMRLTAGVDVTPEVDDYTDDPDTGKAVDKARKIRAAFNFRMVDIEPGTEIYFEGNGVESEEPITATVYSHNRIMFRDKVTSMSAAAFDVFQEHNVGRKSVGGPGYWYIDGESMWERRLRIEREEARDFDSGDFDPKEFS